MGNVVRFPLPHGGAAWLDARREPDRLTELDLELRSIDNAMRALAVRKRSVLASYRKEARRLMAIIRIGLLALTLCAASYGPRSRSGGVSPARIFIISRARRLSAGGMASTSFTIFHPISSG